MGNPFFLDRKDDADFRYYSHAPGSGASFTTDRGNSQTLIPIAQLPPRGKT